MTAATLGDGTNHLEVDPTSTVRVVGLDPSLSSFGVASVTVNPVTSTISTDQLRSHAHGFTRLDFLLSRVEQLCAGADLVVVEGPSYGSGHAGNGRGQHERAGLWWAITYRLWFAGTPTAVVSPGGRAKYATGSGRADKKKVVAAVRTRFPRVHVPGDDAADALTLAAMGCRYLDHPIDPGLSKEQVAAYQAVVWPTLRNRFPLYTLEETA